MQYQPAGEVVGKDGALDVSLARMDTCKNLFMLEQG